MVSEVRLSRSRDHSWGSVLNELDWGSVLNELSWSSVLNELSRGSELSLCWSSRMSGFKIVATIVLAGTEILLRSGEPMLGSLELMFTKNATLLLCLLFGGVHDGQSDHTQNNLEISRTKIEIAKQLVTSLHCSEIATIILTDHSEQRFMRMFRLLTKRFMFFPQI